MYCKTPIPGFGRERESSFMDDDPRSDDPVAEDFQPMPGWVKALMVAGLVAAGVIVVVLVAGQGDHGPGRHTPGGAPTEMESPGHAPLPDRA